MMLFEPDFQALVVLTNGALASGMSADKAVDEAVLALERIDQKVREKQENSRAESRRKEDLRQKIEEDIKKSAGLKAYDLQCLEANTAYNSVLRERREHSDKPHCGERNMKQFKAWRAKWDEIEARHLKAKFEHEQASAARTAYIQEFRRSLYREHKLEE